MFILAIIGSVFNYVINLILYLIGKKDYKTYIEVLKGINQEQSSIFDYRSENLTTGFIVVFVHAILYAIFETI